MLKEMYEIWTKVLTKPREMFRVQARKADYAAAAKHIGLAGVIMGVIAGVLITLLGTAFGGLLGPGYGMFGASVGILSIIGLAIFVPIMAIIGLFVSSAIFYVVARILGGNGSYQTQTYLIAIYTAPLMIIQMLAVIPIVGTLIALAIGIYSLYLLTLVMKETHKFTTGKAVLSWLIPLIVIGVLVLLAMLAAFAIAAGLSVLGA